MNDDYCDCPDGSDEPGTAACSYLSPLSPPQYHPGPDPIPGAAVNTTLALPGFYCKNKGHVPSYIRFESVNDGRCDHDICCDGSDEWQGVGGTKCEDKCKEIGKEYKKHEEVRQKALQGALKRKKELVTEAGRLRKQVELKLSDLQTRTKAEEVKVREAEDALVEVERREKLKAVRGTVGGGGKLPMLTQLAKSRIDELRSSLTRTRSQRDSMRSRIGELEALLSALQADHNPNFNDAGVKSAVQGWEDYAARETDDHWTDAEDRDLDAITASDSDTNGVNWAEFESSDEDSSDPDIAALYQYTSYLPPSLNTWLHDRWATFRQTCVEMGLLPSKVSPSTSESKAVTDARKHRDDAQRDLENVKNDIKHQQEDLDKDYGPDGVFRALKDTCVKKDSGEYEYELCFLAQTKQISKKGGGQTNMGNFVGFEVEMVDDDVPADGKGLGSGERIVMKYENGQHCWNGPNRRTRVVLACAEKEEVWKVSESEKCVYRMEVGTSAVCVATRDGNQGKSTGSDGRKDEL